MSTRIVPAEASVRGGRAAQHGAQSAVQHANCEASMLSTDWGDLGTSDHVILVYEADVHLVDAVSRFVSTGLAAGEAAIVIATPPHREQLDARLRAYGVDLATASCAGAVHRTGCGRDTGAVHGRRLARCAAVCRRCWEHHRPRGESVSARARLWGDGCALVGGGARRRYAPSRGALARSPQDLCLPAVVCIPHTRLCQGSTRPAVPHDLCGALPRRPGGELHGADES